MQCGLDLYQYSPEQGIARRKVEHVDVSIPVSNGDDVAIATCINDDAVILAERKGVVYVYALSTSEEICRVQTGAREYSCIVYRLIEKSELS